MAAHEEKMRGPVPLLAACGGGLVALILLTNWPTYSYLVRGGVTPLTYYLLPGAIAAAVLAMRPAYAAALMQERLVWWCAIFVLSGLAWLLLSQDFPDIAQKQWRLRVLGSYFFLSAFVIVLAARKSFLALSMVACVLVVGALNWFDVMFPSVLVPRNIDGANPGRGAGMFINANAAGALILMVTIAVLPHLAMRFRAAILLLAAVSVAPTFSRFAILGMVFVAASAAFGGLLSRGQRLILLLGIPVLIVGGALYHQAVLQSANTDRNIAERLAWFESLGRESDFSTRERAYVAQRAWETIIESPLVGHGIGTTLSRGQRTGTHNMYLLLMSEQGLFGLALYLGLILLVARAGRRLARDAGDAHSREVAQTAVVYAMFLALYGLVSHNVLEEPHGMFILAFVMAAARSARLGGLKTQERFTSAALPHPVRAN